MPPIDTQVTDFIESDPPIHTPNPYSNPPIWTFDMVEERLVEAWQLLARMPDRERGWLASGTMSLWRMVSRDLGEGVADDEPPARTGLTCGEVDRMEETLGWLDHVAAKDRRLVGLAIAQLARGASRVSWRDLLAPMGRRRGSDGLRMRYGRALRQICERLNSAEKLALNVSIR